MSQGSEDTTDDYIYEDELIRHHFLPSPPAVQAEFGAISDQGKVRSNNEDHYLILRRRRSLDILLTNLPDGELAPQTNLDSYALIVADGMGGAAGGERASLQAIRVGVDLILSAIKWTMKISERERQELIEKLGLYFRIMNRSLIESSQAEPELAGMATTLTAACTAGPEAFIVHAGDSRAYLFRDGALQQLTRDHTMAQYLVDSGQAAPDSKTARRMRHVLTNYLGGPGGGGAAETSSFTLLDGDRLLLCTDGLTEMVTDDEVRQVLTAHPEPNDACRVLVDQALAHGGRDNVTVVLGCYSIPPPPETHPG